VRAGHYLVVECKSEVDLNRAEINKDESGQMNNACAWFEKYYKGATATKILIIPRTDSAMRPALCKRLG